ncbi:unnamed protein product [Peniophora sp. CBMAI 1063]|nr:unnamed protein product [Peniophora sp. CBMAI 1063]
MLTPPAAIVCHVSSRMDFARALRLANSLSARTPADLANLAGSGFDDGSHGLPDFGSCSPKYIPWSLAPARAASPVRVPASRQSKKRRDCIAPLLRAVSRALRCERRLSLHRRPACLREPIACERSEEDEPESSLALYNPFAEDVYCDQELPAPANITRCSSRASSLSDPSDRTDGLSNAGKLSALFAGDLSDLSDDGSDAAVAGEATCRRSSRKRARSPSPSTAIGSSDQAASGGAGKEKRATRGRSHTRAVWDKLPPREPKLVEPSSPRGGPQRRVGATGGDVGARPPARKKKKKPRHDPEHGQKRRAHQDSLGEAKKGLKDDAREDIRARSGPWGRLHKENSSRGRAFRVHGVTADARVEYAVCRGGFRGQRLDPFDLPKDLPTLDALEFWRYDWKDGIIVVLAGKSEGQGAAEFWADLFKRLSAKLNELPAELPDALPADNKDTANRGDFAAINFGVSYGGGNLKPLAKVQHAKDGRVAQD